VDRVILAYGIGISIAFFFLRYAVPVMPKSIAWAGFAAGILVILSNFLGPEMRPSLAAIALFLVGALCIGGAVHMSLKPKSASADTGDQTPASGGNTMGSVSGNKGIVTQGQSGDNNISK
jgi:hypothetical protein